MAEEILYEHTGVYIYKNGKHGAYLCIKVKS